MKRTNKAYFISAALLALSLASCSTPKNITYFQDGVNGATQVIADARDITMRPGDKISILVNSKDPQLVNLFNLPYVSRQLGTSTSSSYNQGIAGYTVDKKGDIDFPVLGDVHVEGLTRAGVAEKIQHELKSRNLVNDAIVTVEFQNLTVAVLGEVNRPGRYSIDKDNLTILDAIGLAGDINIYGLRDKVKVQRFEDGKQKTYIVNMLSADSTFASPAYYLQQNDVVYVEPNDTRLRQSTVNGNNVRSTAFWISLASLLASVATLIFK